MNKLIEIGKAVNVRGLKGEIKLYPYIEDRDTYSSFKTVICDDKDFEVISINFQKNVCYIKLKDIDTIEKATELRNKIFYVREEDLPSLPSGEFYIKDIEGMEVYTENNEFLGIVRSVFKTGANDVYEVKNEDKIIYLPAIKDVILSCDTNNRRMTVHILDGLLDL